MASDLRRSAATAGAAQSAQKRLRADFVRSRANQPHGKVPLSMTKFEIRLHAWFGHAALPFGSGHLCTCGRWFR